MSETQAAPKENAAAITAYDDPDAPWNQEHSEEEMARWNDGVIEEFRDNAGKVGGAYAGGELLLLTTTGAKSGKPHVVPLGLLRRGETMYVSSFIEDRYPAWYHNVKAHSSVTIELGPTTYRGTARALEAAEYDEFAAWVIANNPLLADYQAKVSRPLPLVVLELGEPVGS
ncbi:MULTISPECIES: nitroreductase/quinone reductase family protein [Nocardia]|uniref:Nitroreductase/quinone reductase family protein n=1 Tax=Nocardia implantans TaxID=3108168 RepID=A0ABU6B1W9_9NOCA|nr:MULTISPECIES: nitroreductase/quinone reductase family protein [unclassified Nocardia]MBF6194883.1 nitroreductase family deazaflavin-dependent oxidoreductase [Nocardia beijingensis]MEA3530459.1 nitroreductase/quinone reductase family protein [Nocardia sp. CDC192]MEB3513681.1 nitroreductase/quinone reductase family protein [Nocardia sp. CDC186]